MIIYNGTAKTATNPNIMIDLKKFTNWNPSLKANNIINTNTIDTTIAVATDKTCFIALINIDD